MEWPGLTVQHRLVWPAPQSLRSRLTQRSAKEQQADPFLWQATAGFCLFDYCLSLIHLKFCYVARSLIGGDDFQPPAPHVLYDDAVVLCLQYPRDEIALRIHDARARSDG